MQEYLDLLKSLNSEGVRYVVVGGFATVLHGASSVTFDLDLAVALDGENGTAIICALAPFDPFPPQFGSSKNFVWDERSLFGVVMTLMTKAGKIDILRVLPEIDSFEGLLNRSELRQFYELEVRIASIDDLIAMKVAAGRPKDIEHIRQLNARKEIGHDKVETES